MPRTAKSAEAASVTLKLPAALREQIETAAQAAGQPPRDWMLAALQDAARQHQINRQFTRDAQAAHRQISESGQGYRWEEVRVYFTRLAQYRASGHLNGHLNGQVRPARQPAAPEAHPID